MPSAYRALRAQVGKHGEYAAVVFGGGRKPEFREDALDVFLARLVTDEYRLGEAAREARRARWLRELYEAPGTPETSASGDHGDVHGAPLRRSRERELRFGTVAMSFRVAARLIS